MQTHCICGDCYKPGWNCSSKGRNSNFYQAMGRVNQITFVFFKSGEGLTQVHFKR